MIRPLSISTRSLIVLLVFSAPVSAEVITGSAEPDGAQEVPAVDTNASGAFLFEWEDMGTGTTTDDFYNVTGTILDITPADITGIRIRKGSVGISGPTVENISGEAPFLLGVGLGTTVTLSKGSVDATFDYSELLAGNYYLDVLTVRTPASCPAGALGVSGGCYIIVEKVSGPGCPLGTVEDATGACRKPVADAAGGGCPPGAFGVSGGCYIIVENIPECPSGSVEDGVGACRKPVADEIGNGEIRGQIFTVPSIALTCDSDKDGDCDLIDLDALYAAKGATGPLDMDASGTVDADDIDDWLVAASVPGNPAKPNPADVFRFGDVDLNGDVDSTDLGKLLNNYLEKDLGWASGELNLDQIVDSTDLGLLLNQFGHMSVVAVPEPSFAMMLLSLGALLVGRRRFAP